MADKTTLVLPGNRFSVPKLFKRIVQVTLAVALTSLVALAVGFRALGVRSWPAATRT